MLINAAICNFENNGGGDRALWQRMHDRLASLDLHLLLRQFSGRPLSCPPCLWCP
ncbi:hypothetical protein AB0G86_06365 [Streptomyces scabiei]|uniref:hypothetical protein n=1 Tax=Streptomyces scabiei TaxID=1930 RepID=UPI0033E6914D